jgi:hypothetical protein
LLSELSLDVGKFDNEGIVGGLGDSMLFVCFFDALFRCFEGIFGNVDFLFGCIYQRFYFLNQRGVGYG